MSDSEPEPAPAPTLENERKLLDDLLKNVDYEGDSHLRSIFLGVPLVIHEVKVTDESMFEVMAEYMSRMDVSAIHKFHLLEFIGNWCLTGRPLSNKLLTEMQVFVREKMADTPARDRCLAAIEKSLDDFSPVLGRWKANLSPRSNLLAWLEWEPEQISVALTAMCLPFYRLRSHEFQEGDPGKHLKDLNLRYNSVSKFVTASVLAAAVISKKQGIRAVEKWLETAKDLHERHNYHMLFAIQNGLQKHQVDRLDLLLNNLSKKHTKIKTKIDALFSAKDRMAGLIEELGANVGKESMIPCIFWLVQKATLLKETPVFTADGHLNVDRVVAAVNIFRDMMKMQKMKYSPLREDEQVLWYLMRLEREGADAELSDDELYQLSDAAKAHGSRSRASSFTMRAVKGVSRKSRPSVRNSNSALSSATSPRNENDGAVSLKDVLSMATETLEIGNGKEKGRKSSANKLDPSTAEPRKPSLE